MPKLDNSELVDYIVSWLTDRNGGELAEVIGNMRIVDYNNLKAELQLILTHNGKPPNWTK